MPSAVLRPSISIAVRKSEGSVRRGLRIRIVGDREARMASGKHVSLFDDRGSVWGFWMGRVDVMVNSSEGVRGGDEKRKRVSSMGDSSQFMCSLMNIPWSFSAASWVRLSRSSYAFWRAAFIPSFSSLVHSVTFFARPCLNR